MSTEEQRLLEIIKELGFGNITVVVRKGVPVMVKTIEKDIKLDKD
ncbi:hypothetical protein LCGC14_0418210 [marine sediment metagenome]|uniref:DUF2292 domain-containing protein n=1 Tax=marine sediment metagenome TaxID=412755 RepID=A0A0F9SRX6_9ZZZZ